MGKKHKCPEFENHERWVVPYADMLTLLFALFVVLYAQSVTDKGKSKSVESSMKKSFGLPQAEHASIASQGKGGKGIGIFQHYKGTAPTSSRIKKYPGEPTRIQIINKDMDSLRLKMQNSMLLGGGAGGEDSVKGSTETRIIDIKPTERGFMMTMFARHFFRSGNAAILDPSIYKMLDQLTEVLKEIKKPIEVTGHTDPNPPPAGSPYKDNWELSTARAVAVVKYLTEKHQYPGTMIKATGYAQFKPIALNETEEGRALNRRVDIEIIYDPNNP